MMTHAYPQMTALKNTVTTAEASPKAAPKFCALVILQCVGPGEHHFSFMLEMGYSKTASCIIKPSLLVQRSSTQCFRLSICGGVDPSGPSFFLIFCSTPYCIIFSWDSRALKMKFETFYLFSVNIQSPDMLSSCGFEDCANKEMMAKFIEGQEACEVVIDGKPYDINFKERWQMNPSTKKRREIRCFFGLPTHWKMTDEDALKCIKSGPQGIDAAQSMQCVTDAKMLQRLEEVLAKSLLRHDGRHCNWLHGRSKFVVIKAYQIENLQLWRRRQRFVRSIEDSPSLGKALSEFAKGIGIDLGGNERLLLHGRNILV